MKIIKRVCLEDLELEDETTGQTLDLKKGTVYTTSADVTDGEITIFSSGWVRLPVEYFIEYKKPKPNFNRHTDECPICTCETCWCKTCDGKESKCYPHPCGIGGTHCNWFRRHCKQLTEKPCSIE